MNLRALRRHWDAFARRDPYWAVLTEPDKAGNRWDVEEFFRTGRDEIAAVMAYLSSLGLDGHRGRALDFGCGVGRLTRALADHFDEVVGVDIAPSMLDLARVHGSLDRCRFLLNDDTTLRLDSDSFDFAYSNIVFQHIEPRHTRRYLAELLRVLKPGGVLLFQLPSEPVSESARGLRRLVPRPVRRALRRLRRLREFPRMEGFGIPRSDVEVLLVAAGGTVVDVASDSSAGPAWRSYRYCVRKVSPLGRAPTP